MHQGFLTLVTDTDTIKEVHQEKKIPLNGLSEHGPFYPNQYIELRPTHGKKTALVRVSSEGDQIQKVHSPKISNIEPRNREQAFTMDALMEDSITTVVLTGPAGTGKTILTLAAAMRLASQRAYKKIILTRPMSEVGRYRLGTLPGDADEKFSPYLLNYMTNFEQLLGSSKSIQYLFDQARFEVIPLQLLRGTSFHRKLVIADEMQVCTPGEILTLGTRMGEGSKLVIMGDLDQRDERIARKDTGLYKLANSKIAKESPLVAIIELNKCERGPTAKLFSEIFKCQ